MQTKPGLNIIAFESSIKKRLPLLTDLIEKNPTPYYNISRGELGKVFYYFYLSRLYSDVRMADKAYEILNKVLSLFAQGKAADLMNPTLANGLAGLGLALEVLISEGFLLDEYEGFLSKLDKYVFEGSIEKIRSGNTDFLHGGTGGVHYLTYRLEKNPAVASYLHQYVTCLVDITQLHKQGSFLPNTYMKALYKPDEVDIGLSHGLISSILVLINIYQSGIEQEKVRNLIEEYVHFILCFKNSGTRLSGIHSFFPNSVLLNEENFSQGNEDRYCGGLRWCYGDLNVAHMLYKASSLFSRPQWYKIASQTGLATLQIKDIKRARCHGAFFCHGATGIAHYYDYLYRISGQTDYLSGYHYWMQVSFDQFKEEHKKKENLYASAYFLEGSVGSGLVLMQALDNDLHYWEKLWLLS